MRYSFIIIVLLWAVKANDEHLRCQWNNFKMQNDKIYRSETENLRRMRIFFENIRKIDEHNLKHKRGDVAYNMTINKFTDMSTDEVLEATRCVRLNHTKSPGYKISYAKSDHRYRFGDNDLILPKSVDWVEKGAVTVPRNQMDCGSCYAFSSVAALESLMFIKTGRLISLSEQNLIDCSRNYGNFGCDGGLPALAYDYVKANGIDTYASYPYEDKDSNKCRYSADNVAAEIKDWLKVDEGDEDLLKEVIALHGPVTACIYTTDNFNGYHSGVFHDEECKSYLSPTHAVTIVGYGTDNGTGQNYWLVKNSWGPEWGENGYIRMLRGVNICGIANEAVFPVT